MNYSRNIPPINFPVGSGLTFDLFVTVECLTGIYCMYISFLLPFSTHASVHVLLLVCRIFVRMVRGSYCQMRK